MNINIQSTRQPPTNPDDDKKDFSRATRFIRRSMPAETKHRTDTTQSGKSARRTSAVLAARRWLWLIFIIKYTSVHRISDRTGHLLTSGSPKLRTRLTPHGMSVKVPMNKKSTITTKVKSIYQPWWHIHS